MNCKDKNQSDEWICITFGEKARKNWGRCGKIGNMEYIGLRQVGRASRRYAGRSYDSRNWEKREKKLRN